MSTTTRVAAAASVVLMPVTAGIGDQLRMRADSSDTTDQTLAQLAAIHDHAGLYAAASWFFYAAALLTIPMTVVLWQLAVRRSRRWAWAGAVLGALSAVGQFAHLMGELAMNQVFAGSADLAAAARISMEVEQNLLANALIVPFLLGLMIAPAAQAIALRRARVTPLWAMVAVLVGVVLLMVFGSSPVGSAAWALLLVVGFAPAAAAALRPGIANPAATVATSAPAPA